MGEGAGGRGVFGLSAGARFAPPPLAYPVGGTGEGGPLIRHGIRRDTVPPVGGRFLGQLEACGRSWASAQGRGLSPPVSGMLCDWYGGRRTPHPSRLAPPHLPPCGGKAFGAAGSLREILGLCSGAGLAPACLWHVLGLVRGEEDPSSVTARAAKPSPHRGEGFWGGWKPPRMSAAPLTEKEAA